MLCLPSSHIRHVPCPSMDKGEIMSETILSMNLKAIYVASQKAYAKSEWHKGADDVEL